MSDQNLPRLSEPARSLGAGEALGIVLECSDVAAEGVQGQVTAINSVPSSQAEICERSGDLAGRHQNTVAMTINTAGLEFKFDTTVEHSREALELGAKLELALAWLARSEARLEGAMIKIGELQATLRRLEESSPSP
ncbi:MAG: hypothetical protein KGS72_08365 [Cyanobacteria bacterium REEB67]|nr:hypothetical protein [Cyanobacteria bacterium REEB67]